MEKRTVLFSNKGHNFSKWYSKLKLQNQEIEQQKSRIQSLEDTLNTVKSLALSVQDNCTDGAHMRLMKTLSEILTSPSQSNEIEKFKAPCSHRSMIDCSEEVEEEEEDVGHCSKRLAENTNDGINLNINNDVPPEIQEHFILNLSVEEKVFSNHLLAYKIFSHLEPEDLIKFRLVNKVFNENATRVLKEKKSCLAHFYLIGGERRRINDFNNLVENSSLLSLPLPFTGTSINVSKPNIQSNDVPVTCYGMNRHLAVDLGHIPLPDQEQAVKFLQHSFRTTATTIEELILASLPTNITRYHHLFSFEGSNSAKLPALIRLVLPKRQTTIPSKILKDILKSAPKLKELEGEIEPRQCKPFIVLKKVHLIKTFKLQCKDIMDFHICTKFARTKPKLTRLIFPKFSSTSDGGALILYRNIFKLLCESSQETLDVLEVPHLTFLKFSGRQEPVMKNLKRLHLKYDTNCGRTLDQLALTRINFSHSFPALNFVVIQLECLYRYGENLFLGPEFQGEYGPVNQCLTVKKLKIKGKQMTPTLMFQMYIIFPNIVELHLSKSRAYDEILNALWSSWHNLRTLRLDLRDNYYKKKLDSAFTGLTEQKCQELFESKSYDDMETFATPRGPNLTQLKKLRKLYLEIFRSSTSSQDDQTQMMPFEPFFTDVTCKYAFELLPKLRVKLSVNNSEVKCSDNNGNDGD